MSTASVLIVGDRKGPVGRAVEFARVLVGRGLIDSFWFADASKRGDPRVGYRVTAEGVEEVALFTSLGQNEASVIRVGGVGSAGDEVAPAEVGRIAERITREPRSLAPSHSSIVSARLSFPGWGEIHEATGEFFQSDVNANLVVGPEDRRSDTRIASPLGPEEEESFAQHIAVEVAVHLGLVTGVETPEIDEMVPGVIFGDKPKVRLARSY